MGKRALMFVASAGLLQMMFTCPNGQAQAGAEKNDYSVMAPLERYLIPSESAELALARSAAPASISDDADVMVLRRDGYTSVVKGKNGFVCMVERSWAKPTVDPEFWNPRMRAPHCFNPQAARSFLPIYLMRTRMVLAGKSRAEILSATAAALDSKALPPLESGAMAYMMSKEQYLGDKDKSWHPHVMFFVAGDTTKSWGADQPESPVIAGNDPEERVTILFVLAKQWSDGTAVSPASH